MPLKSREARRLAAAGLATAAAFVATAAPAGAVQTTTLGYQCKYPLIGVKALSIKIDLDIPNTWPAGEATPPFGVNATASAFDMAAGLEAVDGLVGQHPHGVREQADRLQQRRAHHG
ncbi:MAG: hypothetical protein J7474_11435, partial [Arthrobacter sp.]|nr:hypothetical protein [Arthrobacter sp.]